MDIKYLLKIFIISFLILSLILFINLIGLTLSDPTIKKQLTGIVTIEGLTGNQAFCDVNSGFSLEKSCNKLTKYNCGLTSCCVWADNKCKAGNKDGPLFNTDEKGKSKQTDYYYQNECYGNCSK